MTLKGCLYPLFSGDFMNLNQRYQVSQISKLEGVKQTVSTTYNLGVRDYPKKGDTTLITALPECVFNALSSALFEPKMWFMLNHSEARKMKDDSFYTAQYAGRFEIYPDLHLESENPPTDPDPEL